MSADGEAPLTRAELKEMIAGLHLVAQNTAAQLHAVMHSFQILHQGAQVLKDQLGTPYKQDEGNPYDGYEPHLQFLMVCNALGTDLLEEYNV